MEPREAHRLVGADLGVETVFSTPTATYVGWLTEARSARGLTYVALDDFAGVRVSAILPDGWLVHVTLFPPLSQGNQVVHRGWDDPTSPRYRIPDVATVLLVARARSDHRQIFQVQFADDVEPRWYRRRSLRLVDLEVQAALS